MKTDIISGYGLALNWDKLDSFKGFFNNEKVNEELAGELENYEGDSIEEKNKAFFLDEPYAYLEYYVSVINEKIREEYSEEIYGIDYEYSHPDYFVLYFPNVRVGSKFSLTLGDVNKIIYDLGLEVLGLNEDLDVGMRDLMMDNDSIMGKIELTY